MTTYCLMILENKFSVFLSKNKDSLLISILFLITFFHFVLNESFKVWNISIVLFLFGFFLIFKKKFANYWINRPPILVRTVPVILIPNVPFQLKKDSRLAE